MACSFVSSIFFSSVGFYILGLISTIDGEKCSTSFDFYLGNMRRVLFFHVRWMGFVNHIVNKYPHASLSGVPRIVFDKNLPFLFIYTISRKYPVCNFVTYSKYIGKSYFQLLFFFYPRFTWRPLMPNAGPSRKLFSSNHLNLSSVENSIISPLFYKPAFYVEGGVLYGYNGIMS